MSVRFDAVPWVAADLGRTHQLIRAQPSHDPTLGYRMLVPRGWAAATRIEHPPPDLGRAERIGLFCPPQTERTRVVVSCTRLPWEVDPLGWTAARWLLHGWTVHHQRWIDARRFEVGACYGDGLSAQVRRATGMVCEGKLVRVDAEAPRAAWDRLHDDLWPCGGLFVLEAPGRDQLEAWTTHEGPWLRFSVPWSWTARGGPRAGACGASWVAWPEDHDVQCGVVIRVDAGPAELDAHTRRAGLLRDLAQQGVVLSEALHDCDWHRPGLASDLHLRASAQHEGGRLEVRLAQRGLAHGVQLDVLMLAPDPAQHHLDWLRAVRAFEIAIASAEGGPPGKIDASPKREAVEPD